MLDPKSIFKRKLTNRAFTRRSFEATRWLAVALGALLLYSVGYQAGLTKGLVAITPQHIVDLKCRYGAQAILEARLRSVVEDIARLKLVYYTKPRFPKPPPDYEIVINEEIAAEMHSLVGQKIMYEDSLKSIQDGCNEILAKYQKDQ